VSKQPPFPSPWPVRSDREVPPLRVKVPGVTLERTYRLPRNYEPPKFLRLDVRRPGVRSRLTPRPVLRAVKVYGSNEDALLVPESLQPMITGSGDMPVVSPSSENAFRWYRLTRSGGALFSALSSIIGALLVALGTIWLGSGVGKGLLIAGVALTLLAAAGVIFSAWQAPIEGAENSAG
jgi:hypothetical protein